jgi:hypothetical protein
MFAQTLPGMGPQHRRCRTLPQIPTTLDDRDASPSAAQCQRIISRYRWLAAQREGLPPRPLPALHDALRVQATSPASRELALIELAQHGSLEALAALHAWSPPPDSWLQQLHQLCILRAAHAVR